MKTVTEKYHAVLEGKMSKSEFVRQMRQQQPQHITQFNGFDDSVQILKNRGLLFEKKAEKATGQKVYDERPELNHSLEALERGVRYELQAAGLEQGDLITPEDFEKASKKAKKNLEKNPTHYLDLLSGESAHVDKNDKPKETKRGAGDVDTFNGLKKASLKENMYIDDEEWEKEMGRTPEDTEKAIDKELSRLEKEGATLTENLAGILKNLKAKYGDIPGINAILIDFAKMHGKDILAGADAETEFENYIDANYDRLDEKKADKDYDGDGEVESPEAEYKGSRDKAIKAQLKEAVKGIITNILSENTLNEAATNQLADLADKYEDYEGMKEAIIKLQNIVTEVELFYEKTGKKIQDAYDTLGEIRNEDGMRMGPFVAPAIAKAFRLDLLPITEKGLASRASLPKARVLSQADIDAHNSGERPLGEEELEEKQTVFSPVNEKKK